MVTGVRGLCTGLGPAIFGIIFTLFGITGVLDDVEKVPLSPDSTNASDTSAATDLPHDSILPGPPFLFGGCSGKEWLERTSFVSPFSDPCDHNCGVDSARKEKRRTRRTQPQWPDRRWRPSRDQLIAQAKCVASTMRVKIMNIPKFHQFLSSQTKKLSPSWIFSILAFSLSVAPLMLW